MLILSRFFLFSILLMSFSNCNNHSSESSKIDSFSFQLGAISAFAEIVNAGVKPLALSHPLSSKEMVIFLLEANVLLDLKTF